MAVVTITGSDVSGGSPSGGGVGGASNLTTAGAVPYVASAGVLTQDATAFFWDAANDRLTSGNAKAGTGLATRAEFSHASVFGTNSYAILQSSAGQTTVNTASGQPLYFTSNNSVIGMFNATTNNFLVGTSSDDGTNKLQVSGSASIESGGSTNLLISTTVASNSAILFKRNGSNIGYVGNISGKVGLFTAAGGAGLVVHDATGNLTGGGTTDGNYKLDIAASGSSGTLRVYDQTPTTGSTLLAVQAGAGQSGNLQEWRNNAGTVLASIGSGGSVISGGAVVAAAGSYLAWVGRSLLYSPADSVVTLGNSTATDFNRLQFGGTTSSFPSLKRSSATLQVRLADDSAFATIDMGIPKFSGTNSTGAGAALLGSNSPASTLTAPYTWITVLTSDGSTGYIPVWK